jgi:L,D-transpeptidase catalytic domain
VKTCAVAVAVAVLTLTGINAVAPAPAPATSLSERIARSPAFTVETEPPLPVIQPDPNLPVIAYWPSPIGFPADPAPLSTAWLSEGLRPSGRIAVYDAPGGQPRAYLDPTIQGVEISLPIVERRSGWVSVLLPSVNRTVAWIPPGPWTTVALRDQLIVVRSTHQILWFRDAELVRSWVVTLGTDATPTPLGRTFVLGRSRLPGYVYGDTDVLALGAVPDHPNAVPPGLRGAHIGLHTWYHDGELGRNTTDGCIRLTKSGQELLLAEIVTGTEVVVVDHITQTEPTQAEAADR